MGLPPFSERAREQWSAAPGASAQGVGPSGAPLARPSFDTTPEARRVPRANAIRYGSIELGEGFFPNAADATAIKLELDRPEIFELVQPLDGAAGPLVNYFELWASPEEAYPNADSHFPWYRGVGSRLWLPSPGTWYVVVNVDVGEGTAATGAKMNYARLDASNDAWARTYMDIGSGLASTVRGGWQANQACPAATEKLIFNIGAFPEAKDILISNTGAAACIINVAADTNGGTIGRSLAAGGLTEFARGTYAAASVWAYSTAGTTVQVYIGGR